MQFFNCKSFTILFLLLFCLNFFLIYPATKDSLNNGNGYDIRIADKPFYTITGLPPLKQNDIKPIPISIFVGTYGFVFYLQHIGQMQTIWQNLGSFHIIEDGKYALYADKAGHFYGTFLTSYILRSSLIECGLDFNWSTVIGTILGLGYTSYVEILDGFSVDWGFSPSDFYADIGGALFFLGYSYLPFMQNFTPKFMYFPPRWFNSYSRVPSKMFIDDYSAHSFFISVNVYNLLPETFKKYFPSWLELSVGYAVRNLCDPFHYTCDPNISEPISQYAWGNRKIIIALDYDFVKLFPDGCPFWNWLKQSLNYIKFPSPAIEFGSPTRFYILYPFPLNLGRFKF